MTCGHGTFINSTYFFYDGFMATHPKFSEEGELRRLLRRDGIPGCGLPCLLYSGGGMRLLEDSSAWTESVRLIRS